MVPFFLFFPNIYKEKRIVIMKRINILEAQCKLLTEGMSNILYHFTSLNHGYNICKDDKIYLQSAYAKDADNYDNKRTFYLSCTRIRSSQFGYSKKFSKDGVRIVLDGDALSTRYKGRQINYWGGGTFTDKFKYMQDVEKDRESSPINKAYTWELNRWKKEHPNASDEEIENWIAHNFHEGGQHHVSNESEDRIFSYESVINDVHKYIKSVDVLLIDFENDPNKMAFAQSILYNTILGSKYVKIYDSEKEFNNPNGKDANDKVEYGKGYINNERVQPKRIKRILEAVICFIAYANHDFDGKNFPRKTMEYLKKYELSEFKGEIGDIMIEFKRMCGWAQGIAEKLDAVRRELSDEPNEYTYKLSQMLSDYCMSIGAKSFRDAYLLKKEMGKEYNQCGYVYDRIDTSVKYNFIVVRNHVLSLYPNKDRFSDAMGWDNDMCQNYAEAFADEITQDYDNKGYQYTSKNYGSMFHYLFKLIRKGSVLEVYNTLKKIGLDDEFLKSYNIELEIKALNYWGAVGYNTVNTFKSRNDKDYDYMTVTKKNDKEIENYFKEIQKASQK